MKPEHWTLDDIDWSAFRPDLVTPQFLAIAKAASVVEHNGKHYADYLYKVFPDDDELKEAIKYWALEEVQHGQALGKWAEMADPNFDFATVFQEFAEAYQLPLDIDHSVRGSKTGELIARCIVETGTSSFYTAIADQCEEPVLTQISRKIAADEFRHYKLFYDYMKPYQEKEKLSFLKRFKIVLGRVAESSDDELSLAFHIANRMPEPYEREKAAKAYAALTYSLYQPQHISRVVSMALKPTGLNPQGLLSRVFTFMLTKWMKVSNHFAQQKGSS